MKTKLLSLLVVSFLLFTSTLCFAHPHTQNHAEGTAGSSGGVGSNADPSDPNGTSPDIAPGSWGSTDPPYGGGGNSEGTCGAPGWSVNPVNLNLYVTDTPIWHRSALGPGLSPGISYNSMLSPTGSEIFGNNWSFQYASFLEVGSNNYVTVTLGTGEEIIFKPDGSGGYLLPYKGVTVSLAKIGNDHFEYRYGSGKVLVFDHHVSSLNKTFLSSISDAYGHTLTIAYNGSRPHTLTDALGVTHTLHYNDNGMVERIDDPFSRSASYSYDENRNLISITDMGGYTTELEYDNRGYLSGIVNPAGRTGFYIEPPDSGGTATYPAPGAAMGRNHRLTITHPDGGKEEYFYSAASRVTHYVAPENYLAYQSSSYNNWTNATKTVYHFANTSKGALEEVSSIVLPSGTSLVSSVDYATGKILSSSDGADNYSTYSYTDNGQIATITSPNGEITTYIYAENGIDLVRIESGIGAREYIYNDYHQVTSSTDYLGNTTSYEYNLDGQLTKITDPLGTETVYTYNSDHLVTEIHKNGQLVSSMSYDGLGRLVSSTDSTGLTTSHSYDNFNHVISTTYPDGKTTTVEYGSGAGPHLVTRITDRSGRRTNNTYDASRRRIRAVNPEGGVSEYVYDLNSNLVQFIDPNGNITGFSYNSLNQLTAKTYGDGTSVAFSYNAQGRISSRVNARGITTSYYYDELGNLTSLVNSDSTPGVTITYDNYSRPVAITDGSGNYSLNYDPESRLLNIDGPLENDTITYSYDELGRKIGVSIENGRSHAYTYDPLSRLTAIQSGGEEYGYNYVDEKNPLLQSLTRPNGSSTNYEYDGLNRLLSVTNLNSASDILSKYDYTYNEQGLKGSEEVTGGLPITGFEEGMCSSEFNIVNQLLNLNDEAGEDHEFTYDADGNMVTGFTPEGFTYTAGYDAENRLSVIEYTDTDWGLK